MINIAYPENFETIEILNIIEQFFNKKSKIKPVNQGTEYNIEISETRDYFIKNNLNNKEKYLISILEKHFK